MKTPPARPDDPDGDAPGGAAFDADDEDFARAMADVRRLTPDPRGDRVLPQPHLDKPRPATTTAPVDLDGEGTEHAGEAYAARGVDRRELRRLKRGDYRPGDTLDVHGMTTAEAVAAVTRFVERSRRQHRCIAIIHGRGLHSAGSVPILKSRVREALRQHRAVLAFTDAPRSDGGIGAVYVLLRRPL